MSRINKFKKLMLWIFAIVFFVLVIFNLIGYIFSAPVYKGPVTDHFDGKTFKNPGNVKAKGLSDLIKWVRTREKQPWLEDKDVLTGAAPTARVAQGVKVTFVNHATFLIQVDGLNILTDPVWSERVSPVSFAGPKRMRPPGIRFEDLPPIDVIIISHNHYDHLDRATMRALISKFDPQVITPLGVGAFIEGLGSHRVTDMDWWQEHEISGETKIACVPAQHFSGRGTFDRDATLWCGYVILRNDGHVYFAGDSGYGDFFKDIGKQYGGMKISLIPIGAYLPRWFMSPIHISPDEAVQVHQDVGSEVSVGMHFGTYPLADDGQHQPQHDLRKALENSGISYDEFFTLEEGESLTR